MIRFPDSEASSLLPWSFRIGMARVGDGAQEKSP